MPISLKLTHPILFVLLLGHIHVHAQSVAESRRIIETLDAASGKPVSGAPTTPVAQTPMDQPGNVSPDNGFGRRAGGNPLGLHCGPAVVGNIGQ